MGRTVRRIPEALRRAQLYLLYRDQEAAAKREKDKATAVPGDKKANWLKDYVLEHGEPNGKDIEWVFDDPLTIGDATYRGFKAQASEPSPELDEDAATELLETKELLGRVKKTIEVEVWDWDEIYVLNQQGLITDEELDKLLVTPDPSFSLVVMK